MMWKNKYRLKNYNVWGELSKSEANSSKLLQNLQA